MKDAFSQDLRDGDKVLIPAIVFGGRFVTASSYPNLSPQSAIGVPVFPSQVIRANPGDDVNYSVNQDNDAKIIVREKSRSEMCRDVVKP